MLKQYEIYDSFHEKRLFIYIGDYERFCVIMEKKWFDTTDRWTSLAMYTYEESIWGHIRLWQPRLDRFIHELTHYTREIGEYIWYWNEPLHEYYAYAMEFYTREAYKKIKSLKV
jgi:hypothetical protein